jgi:NAD(P)-dependent dehydrogenase (short-subunit alcohol dehydrogenase family)
MTSTKLRGRRAIVTGAADGLGRAFARALADNGASVAGCDIDPAVTSLESDLQERHVSGFAQVFDINDPSAVRAFVDAAAARFDGLDILVSNAGTVRLTSPITDPWSKTVEDFDAVMGVNLRGTYLIGRAAIPFLVSRGGDIVNITTDHIHTCGYPTETDHSDAGQCPYADGRRPPLGGPNFDVYDSSKWALKGLTNVWASLLASHGVRVNSLGMGATDTPMLRGFLGGPPTDPTVMTPEQVAEVLIALLAEGSTGRTGDSVELWPGHPCELPPLSLDGEISMAALANVRV